MVFQNYFAEMPTPEENLAAKQEELKAKVEEYNAEQSVIEEKRQSQQEKLQGLIKLQGAVEALQEVVTPSEEG